MVLGCFLGHSGVSSVFWWPVVFSREKKGTPTSAKAFLYDKHVFPLRRSKPSAWKSKVGWLAHRLIKLNRMHAERGIAPSPLPEISASESGFYRERTPRLALIWQRFEFTSPQGETTWKSVPVTTSPFNASRIRR
jgi:hypothetical protein